jgi:predicted NAD/FAD-dependent oxidoreductase
MARVVVLGAGVAGLVGARVLERSGHEVVVLDKGRRPGGRMATRRPHGPDGPVFDHGAQFVTLREQALADETQRWRDEGWLVEWFRGSPDEGTADGDGHPRFRGAPYQRALPEALAAELADVRTGVRVASLTHEAGAGWTATTDEGDAVRGDALLCTPPVPQTLTLLETGGVTLPDALDAELRTVAYEPCIAVLALPLGVTALPPPGVVRLPDHDVLDIVTDNHSKGISPVPAVTIHGSGDWSRAHWDRPDDEVGAALIAAASEVLGTDQLVVSSLQRWRYSAPTTRHDDLAPGGELPGPIRFAGDCWAGGRVEGAALSGHTAATRLVDALSPAR